MISKDRALVAGWRRHNNNLVARLDRRSLTERLYPILYPDYRYLEGLKRT